MNTLLMIDYVGAETGVRMFWRNLLEGLLALPEGSDWVFRVAMPAINYHGRPVEWHRQLDDERLHFTVEGDASQGNTPTDFLRWILKIAGDSSADVVYFPFPYLSSCPRLPQPMLTTVHDFNYKSFDTWSGSIRHSVERDIPQWISRCTPIVSSRFIASELISYYPEAAGRAWVVPLGIPHPSRPGTRAEWQAFKTEHHLDGPYLLNVGWLAPHKNQSLLLEAGAQLMRLTDEVRLVFVGPNSMQLRAMADAHDPYVRHLIHLADNLGLQHGRDYYGLGRVSDVELEMLYEHATALVMPTLYEAGSFPVREALRIGCPVVCSNVPPLLEDLGRVGGDPALLFDPFDVHSLVNAIAEVMRAPEAARTKAKSAKARVENAFDWHQTARGYLNAFAEALWKSRESLETV